MRCGTRALSRFSQAAAAPATVSGEPIPLSHWGKPGKAVTGGDPRARRPTVDSRFAGRGASAVVALYAACPVRTNLQAGEAGRGKPSAPGRSPPGRRQAWRTRGPETWTGDLG